MIRLAVVEDEPAQREILIDYIRRYFAEPDSVELAVFSDGADLLAHYPPHLDILFLDIVMERSNGVDVAKKIREKDARVLIIFVTELFQYALEGYTVNATDFLVKPLYYTSFCSSMKRALSVLRKRMPNMMQIHFDKTTSFVDVSTIYYIETENKKTRIHAQSGDYLCSDTMRALEEKLEPHGFIRCHQAYLVNVRHVESVKKQEILVHGMPVPISRHKREDFLQKFVKYVGGIM